MQSSEPVALIASIWLAAMPIATSTQPVPEGIQSNATGPTAICGITGQTTADFQQKVQTAEDLTEMPVDSPRFRLFQTSDGFVQWVFTKAGEPAYPAVTCLRVTQKPDKSWSLSRDIHCDSSRAACDELFVEFRELDDWVRAELAAAAGP